MSKSKQTAAASIPAAPENFWPLRWLGEIEAPLFDTGGVAVEGEERNLLGLAQMATQPWTLFGAQLAMANLALTQFGAAQAEWTRAWSEAWSGIAATAGAQAGDRSVALAFDPFALVTQAQAFASRCVEEWTALTHSGPARIS